MPEPDVSVIICTHNRAASLHETLEALCDADTDGIAVEIIVVDNGSTDATAATVERFSDLLRIQYVFEPVPSETGKARCLNRVLDSRLAGTVTAVVDDDVTIDHDWIRQAVAACHRHPGYDFFAGPIRIRTDRLPEWARDARIRGWVYGEFDHGLCDIPLRDGGAFAGANFWFRTAAAGTELRFPVTWLTEPTFFNLLLGHGHKGIYIGRASVVHRFQPELLKPDVALMRAIKTGHSAAEMRLQPYHRCIKAARRCHDHPLLARGFCIGHLLRCRLLHLAAAKRNDDRGIARRILAAEGMAYYAGILRVCRTQPEYRLFGPPVSP